MFSDRKSVDGRHPFRRGHDSRHSWAVRCLDFATIQFGRVLDGSMAVAQKTGIPKWNPIGKWKHGPRPAVCPSDRLILSHARCFFARQTERDTAGNQKGLP